MRILIVDDHAILRRGIKEILEDDGIGTDIGEAGDGSEAIRMIREGGWEMVLLDIALPKKRGVDVLNDIRDEFPKLPVLIVSNYPEEQYAVRLIKSGAQGYLTKETAPDDLVNAVKTIAQGRRYISPKVAELMADSLAEPANPEQTPLHQLLSNREFEVFLALAAGTSLTETASNLSLSVKTVSSYRSRVLKKMNARTNADLTIYATTHKLLENTP